MKTSGLFLIILLVIIFNAIDTTPTTRTPTQKELKKVVLTPYLKKQQKLNKKIKELNNKTPDKLSTLKFCKYKVNLGILQMKQGELAYNEKKYNNAYHFYKKSLDTCFKKTRNCWGTEFEKSLTSCSASSNKKLMKLREEKGL